MKYHLQPPQRVLVYNAPSVDEGSMEQGELENGKSMDQIFDEQEHNGISAYDSGDCEEEPDHRQALEEDGDSGKYDWNMG